MPQPMRAAVQQGKAILDVGWTGKATVIRSAWLVSDVSDEDVLSFRRYHFVKPNVPPLVYRKSRFRSPRHGAILDGDELKQTWRKVMATYESLPSGARPSVFDPEDWRRCLVSQPTGCAYRTSATRRFPARDEKPIRW